MLQLIRYGSCKPYQPRLPWRRARQARESRNPPSRWDPGALGPLPFFLFCFLIVFSAGDFHVFFLGGSGGDFRLLFFGGGSGPMEAGLPQAFGVLGWL